jgi:hypothetical protein
MKKIGILYHPKVEATYVTAQQLEAFLASQGAHAWLCSAWEIEKAQSKLDGTELVLSVGGDGTILRAAQVVFQSKIPLTGINLGTLGFMTELNIDEAQDKLKELFQGKGWTDERVMLEVALSLKARNPPSSSTRSTMPLLPGVPLPASSLLKPILTKSISPHTALTASSSPPPPVAPAMLSPPAVPFSIRNQKTSSLCPLSPTSAWQMHWCCRPHLL